MSPRFAVARHHLAIYDRPREIECERRNRCSIVARTPLALTCGPYALGCSLSKQTELAGINRSPRRSSQMDAEQSLYLCSIVVFGDLARVSGITTGALLMNWAQETGDSGEFAFFWRSLSQLGAGTIAHGRSRSSDRVSGWPGQAIPARSPLHARSGAEMARKAWTEQGSHGLRPEAGNLE